MLSFSPLPDYLCEAADSSAEYSSGLADESSQVNDMSLPSLVERDDSTSGEAVIRRMSVWMKEGAKSWSPFAETLSKKEIQRPIQRPLGAV